MVGGLTGRSVRAVAACAIAVIALLGCTPSRPALQFSPTALPDATVGAAYAAAITVTQAVTPVGGVSVTDGALPDGLVVAVANEPINTIEIAGKPKAAGSYTFTVAVWCYGTNVNGQTGTQQYTLVVK